MFAVHEVTIDTGFADATGRLIHLVSEGLLHSASHAAYEGGQAAEMRVGPVGSLRGLSKLVEVRFLDPIHRGGSMSIPLRWEATGAAGELFPVLDADLTLYHEGPGRSRLELASSYRPPLGRPGAALDRAILHRVASATLRSLLHSVADSIADAVPDSRPGPAPAWRPSPDPGES